MKNLKLLSDNNKGEIATVLTFLSIGLMLVGTAIGSIASRQRLNTLSEAQTNSFHLTEEVYGSNTADAVKFNVHVKFNPDGCDGDITLYQGDKLIAGPNGWNNFGGKSPFDYSEQYTASPYVIPNDGQPHAINFRGAVNRCPKSPGTLWDEISCTVTFDSSGMPQISPSDKCTIKNLSEIKPVAATNQSPTDTPPPAPRNSPSPSPENQNTPPPAPPTATPTPSDNIPTTTQPTVPKTPQTGSINVRLNIKTNNIPYNNVFLWAYLPYDQNDPSKTGVLKFESPVLYDGADLTEDKTFTYTFDKLEAGKKYLIGAEVSNSTTRLREFSDHDRDCPGLPRGQSDLDCVVTASNPPANQTFDIVLLPENIPTPYPTWVEPKMSAVKIKYIVTTCDSDTPICPYYYKKNALIHLTKDGDPSFTPQDIPLDYVNLYPNGKPALIDRPEQYEQNTSMEQGKAYHGTVSFFQLLKDDHVKQPGKKYCTHILPNITFVPSGDSSEWKIEDNVSTKVDYDNCTTSDPYLTSSSAQLGQDYYIGGTAASNIETTNLAFASMVDKWTKGTLGIKEMSAFIYTLSRTPGLQTKYCNPFIGECVFQPKGA